MKKTINSSSMFFNNENDKIMFILEHVFEAKNLETAVTLEQVINKGIEMNLCETWPTDHVGHPWYPHTSTMCGIHKTMGTLNGNYECHLHRAFVKKEGHKTKVFVYWVDRTRKAEVIGKNGKPVTRNAKVVEKTPEIIRETKLTFTQDQMEKKMAENPGIYVILNGKLYKREFVINHPEKFDQVALMVAQATN